MSNVMTVRGRASLALATVLALLAAMFSVGISPATAAPVFAIVSGHAAQSPTNNQVATWCGSASAGKKIEPVGSSPYQLEDDYNLVVVKAGSNQQGNFANTLFGAAPSQGEWVWADTNGNGVPEVGTGDKDSISHIIVCFKDRVTPPPGTIKAIKEWTVNGPDEYSDGQPGDLLLNEEVKDWNTSYTFPADTEVTVAEDTNSKPPTAEGWTCTVDEGATTYQVGSGDPSHTLPTVTITSETLVTVTVTNTANCNRVVTQPRQGSVEALKKWTITGLDPNSAEGFVPGAPGTLTFNGVEKAWTNNTTTYDVGTQVTVTEAGNGTPPTATGYKCVINTAATTYTVGETTNTTPPTVIIAANTAVTVTVRNTVTCTKDIPPPPATTTLTVTKVWVGTPPGYTLTSTNAGPLNVTVGGTPTNQAWGATQTNLKVGDKASVSEGTVPALTPYPGYTCSVTGSPEYAVNGGGFTTTAASFPLAPSANTVTVRNTVTCAADSAVGGTEDTNAPTDESDSVDDEQAVAGSEDELAATGGNVDPAVLGLLLLLSGAAFVTARKLALK